MTEEMRFYLNLATGFSALMMLAEAAGAWVCLSFRHLSSWLVLAAVGFGGMIAATAAARASSMTASFPPEWLGPSWVVTSGVSFASVLALVVGLGMGLVEIRHRLALALEPRDVRR